MRYLLTTIVLSLFSLLSTLAAQPERWQQHADYSMNIDMDVAKHQYHGTMHLEYTNNSPDTLRQSLFSPVFQRFSAQQHDGCALPQY